MQRYRMKNGGFTLFELIISLTLIAIISGIVAMVINTSFRAVDRLQSRKTIALDGSSSASRFAREFAQLTDEESLLVADIDLIEFVNNQGVTVEYELTDGKLYRRIIGQGQAEILTENVNVAASSFSYFDENNGQLTNLPLSGEDRAKVWIVELALNLANGDQVIPYLVDVFPENLKLAEGAE